MDTDLPRPNPDESNAVKPSTEMVLLSAISRVNAHSQEKFGYPQVYVNENSSISLSAFCDDYLDNITARVDSHIGPSYVSLAHFDPAQAKFLSYPEIVTPDEFAVIEKEAIAKRQNARQESAYDVDAYKIRTLLNKQRELLLKDGLIDTILVRHNELDIYEPRPGESNPDFPVPDAMRVKWKDMDKIYKDESTSFHLSLMPAIGDLKGGLINDYFVGVQLNGALSDKGVRVNPHITLAVRPDRESLIYNPDSRLVTPSEYEHIKPLITGLQVAAMEDPAFDAYKVALRKDAIK